MSVDQSREFYDSRAAKLFEKFGGGDWPSIILKDGFESALHFGDFGYGKVIVDREGIVRAVNPRDLEAALAEVFKAKD